LDIVLSNLAHNDYERGEYSRKSEILIYDRERKLYVDERERAGIRTDEIGANISGVFLDELFSGSLIEDFNNDSVPDILFTQVYDNSYSYSRFFTGISDAPYFGETTYVSGILIYDSLGAAYTDLNQDGCPDIIVSGKKKAEENRTLKIFLNRCDYKGDYISFSLTGHKSGSIPTGSKIRIYLNREGRSKILLRQVEATNAGFGQQNSEILHFGLGSDYEIEHIEIEWQSGIFQILYQYKINSLNFVTEPESPENCRPDLIEFDENYYYLENSCNSKDRYFTFVGNSCENKYSEVRDYLIGKSVFSGDNFCRDFVLVMDDKGLGRKYFINP
ncbi:MAG: CRTAC1 family protein, partial [Deltaproteobacteria bacterium]|nr:CRTAC1 family protein [Deltaproteobacteria bacterium]